MQEEALKPSAAAQELWSKKTHPVWQSFRQKHCTEALAMKYATSMTTRGEAQSRKASIPQQGCLVAGWEEFCHVLNASACCTCQPPFIGYACASSSSQPWGPKDLCSDESPDQRTQRWHKKTCQAYPDACPTDSRFLKMPKSCNPNWGKRSNVCLFWLS